VAEELVQDAFEQVVRRWDSIDNPPGYLRVAVVNGARSWGRRRRRGVTVEAGFGVETVARLGLDADAIAMRTALASLRLAEREAIVLRYYAGMTDTQIAISVGRPVGTVKSLIHRGLGRLKEALT